LKQVGIVPDYVSPARIDECVQKGELALAHAQRLAAEKATYASEDADRPGAIVIAADTVVACGRRILPKATTAEEVRDCLRLLSGRRHQVVTAVAVARGRHLVGSRTVRSRVAFRNLAQAEIESYMLCGEGCGKAGGYAIQGRAEAFVRFINGSYSNIVGLPLLESVMLLRAQGFPC
jgi:nucleoside triphosphate pyrophosphatase